MFLPASLQETLEFTLRLLANTVCHRKHRPGAHGTIVACSLLRVYTRKEEFREVKTHAIGRKTGSFNGVFGAPTGGNVSDNLTIFQDERQNSFVFALQATLFCFDECPVSAVSCLLENG